MLQECRSSAIRNREGFGVWGGMSEDERSSMLYATGTPPRGGVRNPARHHKSTNRNSR